jgi:hypothetical protein
MMINVDLFTIDIDSSSLLGWRIWERSRRKAKFQIIFSVATLALGSQPMQKLTKVWAKSEA